MSDVFLGMPSKKVVDFIEKQRCFWLEAEGDGLTIEFKPEYGDFPSSIHLSISRDGKKTWTAYDGYVIGSGEAGDPILKAGDRVYFRAGHPDDPDGFMNERMSFWDDYYGMFVSLMFVFNGINVKACGNLNCLLKKDGKVDELADNCYAFMFQNCTSLTAAPALPALTLGAGCYNHMFFGCNSLAAAPALPATALADDCYASMFAYCVSLTAAPALPATALYYDCYASMFENCVSLTTAPALPATTLANFCYYCMFYNCTSLSKIEVSFTEWKENACLYWVNHVASAGAFICPAALPDARGDSSIPDGWTVVNK